MYFKFYHNPILVFSWIYRSIDSIDLLLGEGVERIEGSREGEDCEGGGERLRERWAGGWGGGGCNRPEAGDRYQPAEE
jgi:hypothetical protein